MPLRDYQEIIYNEIPQALKKGPVLVQAPARSGKSHIISATAARIIKAGRIPLVLTHRDKIQKQLLEHCSGVSIDAGVEHVFVAMGSCYVAMHQTLIKRPAIIEQLQKAGKLLVLIVDEAHRGDFNKLFDVLPEAYRVGFSATPAWRWAKWLPTYYTSLIHGPQPRWLTEQGSLTPVDYYEMRNDLQNLQKGSNGEYTEESQAATFDRAKLYDGLFAELQAFRFTKCIIFCASKKAADKLSAQFAIYDQYRVTVYYSGLPKYNLALFTEFDANVLITVSALSEGFDHPPIDMNVLWRATTSLPLFIQMGMRGATPHTGKERTTVLDFGGNNSRFGGHRGVVALTMDRDWNALWQAPETPPRLSNGVAAIKNCPACDFIISAMARSCGNCGYIYPEAAVALKEGELVKIEEDLKKVTDKINKFTGRKISTLLPDELALYAITKNKRALAGRVAKAMEMKRPGYLATYGRAMAYHPRWVDRQLIEIAELRMYQPDSEISFYDITIK